jgi:hemoglobin
MGSIYAEVGGSSSVSTAVDDFYVRVLADPTLAPYFVGKDIDRLEAHQRSFIAAATGGSEIYSGRSMKDAHAGLDVTPAAFDRVVEHLVATLDGLGVPAETIGTIGGALAPLKDEIAVTVPI